MKYKTIVIFLATIINLQGNVISDIMNKIKTGSPTVNNASVAKVNIPNTNMYYYKFVPNTRDIHITVKQPINDPRSFKDSVDLVAVKEALEWQQTPDSEPVKPVVVSKNPVTDEAGQAAHKTEVDVLYGKDSPMRDDAVSDAWKEAQAAQRRLDEHRKYMESVRLARLAKAQAKKNDTQENSN